MNLSFWKMSGAGNDFVMIDNREGTLALSREAIAHLCDRHFGIGADGLLAVEPPILPEADFRMRYYNADGGEAEMCGNGARCFARFARKISDLPKDRVAFETMAGIVRATFDGDLVQIELTPPEGLQLRSQVTLVSGVHAIHHCNTGVPHAVLIVPNVERAPLAEWGPEIRFHADFQPHGTNVNFLELTGLDSIRVRTYERGVEGETLACGTGVAACAIIAHLVRGVRPPVKVAVQGRCILEVDFRTEADRILDVKLKGPASFVFSGQIEI